MAALIWPVIAIVVLLALWFVFGAKKTRDQAQMERALPDDPHERRQAELEHLRREHAEADPMRTQHPARRP
jgi:hypothetical protein